MATRSKSRKSASRKTRNGDSYKGIPADKREQVALTVRLVRATGQRTTPGKVYLGIAQDEAAKAHNLATDKKEQAAKVRKSALEALKPTLLMLLEAAELAQAVEDDDADINVDSHTLARCSRLLINEAGAKLEHALCDLGLIPEDDWSNFCGNLKSAMPKAARPAAEVASHA